ncbi:hypothetical protein Tco_0466512 [Tanacetum coccineum]
MGIPIARKGARLMEGDILQENKEVFAWAESERTAIPRFVMEHQLKIYLLAEPMAHKRRPMASEGRLALKEKVFRWQKEGLIRKVQRPEWIANTIPVKLTNGTWKVQVDYSSLNKVCAKDMYPFPEEGEGLASIMGFPHKSATLQRMIEKVLENQRGWNVEIYLEEIVIKSKSELDLVQDVEETLRKLKRVNIKIDPVTSLFGVKEGRFLGHMVWVRFEATEGSDWTNEAEESLQRIKRKLKKLQTLAVPKEGEILMLCLCHKDETISSVLLVERAGIQISVSYASRPLQGMEICYTLTEKMVQVTNSHDKIPEGNL